VIHRTPDAMLRAVSRTTSVGFGGREIWVYDASLSLVLAEVIRDVETTPAEERPAWWPAIEEDLRIQAVISDFHLDLDLGLDAAQRAELARLLDAAADRVGARDVFTAEEASAWAVLSDLTVIFRSDGPEDTAPAAFISIVRLRGETSLPPQPPPSTRPSPLAAPFSEQLQVPAEYPDLDRAGWHLTLWRTTCAAPVSARARSAPMSIRASCDSAPGPQRACWPSCCSSSTLLDQWVSACSPPRPPCLRSPRS
jgi:hypothetical protein